MGVPVGMAMGKSLRYRPGLCWLAYWLTGLLAYWLTGWLAWPCLASAELGLAELGWSWLN